ncbi:MAG TPA: IS21 family transposase, partial [Ramlibacter sp.]|nr:IS21 family transposase [Ramlibacter sp.]
MPGKRITDHQVHKYQQHRNKLGQSAAAAKAGISERSARRIDHSEALPSQRPPRNWRTREDPLAAAWDSQVVPLLQVDSALNAVTLLEELQRRHPGQYGTSVLRTLQRRMRQWRALHGAEREIYFAQEHPPGRLGLSDFTVADDLGVEIGGAAFPHRLYQFALAHSGWRHAQVIVGGESFIALSTGLQAALWHLGGVPEEHRTDSLSAAFNNLAEQQELTRRYEDLCRHYGMRASRCNPGQSHENGAIESRHDSLKTALDQALRLRGSRGFDERAGYEAFVDLIVQRFNGRAAKRLAVERPMLRALPVRRTAEYEELPARVSKYAIFTVRGVQYSAPSQLIGHRLMVRQYAQHIECWLGGQCVLRRPRATHRDGQRHPRDIDYRHLVAALKRKP